MASGNLKSTTHKKQVIVMDYTTGAARREARRPAHPSARGGRQGASAESGAEKYPAGDVEGYSGGGFEGVEYGCRGDGLLECFQGSPVGGAGGFSRT